MDTASLDQVGLDYKESINSQYDVEKILHSNEWEEEQDFFKKNFEKYNLPLKGEKALIIGCDNGQTAYFLSQYFGQVFVFEQQIDKCLFVNQLMQKQNISNVFIYNGMPSGMQYYKTYKMHEQTFDFLISFNGIQFIDLEKNSGSFASLLKKDAYALLFCPYFWFVRTELEEIEKIILDFAKINDKSWLFNVDFSSIMEQEGLSVISLDSVRKYTISRYILAQLSNFKKLITAINTNNKAVLGVCKIPEKAEIRLSSLLLKKEKHILSAQSLFSH